MNDHELERVSESLQLIGDAVNERIDAEEEYLCTLPVVTYARTKSVPFISIEKRDGKWQLIFTGAANDPKPLANAKYSEKASAVGMLPDLREALKFNLKVMLHQIKQAGVEMPPQASPPSQGAS